MNNLPAVLYVEDEEMDALLMGLAVKRAALAAPLQIASNGGEAIDYLAGTGAYANRNDHPLPCLVLLDLKLPGSSGFEILAWLRKQPHFSSLPVIIYTSSSSDADREKARQLGATDYAVKKADVNAIAEWLLSLAPYCHHQPMRT